MEHDKWCRRRRGCGRSDQLQAWSHLRGPCLLWKGKGGKDLEGRGEGERRLALGKGFCCISYMREITPFGGSSTVAEVWRDERAGTKEEPGSGTPPPPSTISLIPCPSPFPPLPPLRPAPRQPTPPALNTPFTHQQLLAFRAFHSTLLEGS